jgi:peroxiredoxin
MMLALVVTLATAVAPGEAAPDFKLKDTDGKTVSLSDFKGKTVVLEWFNPECPFVRAAHTKGSLVGLAKKYTDKGIVWLAINSAAQGKQGFGPEKSKEGAKKFEMGHPVLLDETGATGHAYGATNTPHMFVINKDGKVVYAGAIDNSPDGEKGEPQGGTLVNYVEQALDALAAGKPVPTAQSKAYGCGVKYGS